METIAVGMVSRFGWLQAIEKPQRDSKSPDIRQEGTMQLRHIRPGSLEWQDAKADEADQPIERLTPEETVHLRKLADDRRLRKNNKDARTEVH